MHLVERIREHKAVCLARFVDAVRRQQLIELCLGDFLVVQALILVREHHEILELYAEKIEAVLAGGEDRILCDGMESAYTRNASGGAWARGRVHDEGLVCGAQLLV